MIYLDLHSVIDIEGWGLQIANSEMSILSLSVPIKQKSCQYYTTVPYFSSLDNSRTS